MLARSQGSRTNPDDRLVRSVGEVAIPPLSEVRTDCSQLFGVGPVLDACVYRAITRLNNHIRWTKWTVNLLLSHQARAVLVPLSVPF